MLKIAIRLLRFNADEFEELICLVLLFFGGFKAGYLEELSAGEDFEHLRIIAGPHVQLPAGRQGRSRGIQKIQNYVKNYD